MAGAKGRPPPPNSAAPSLSAPLKTPADSVQANDHSTEPDDAVAASTPKPPASVPPPSSPPPLPLPTPPRGEGWGALAVFATALSIYGMTMNPAVAGGDAGEIMLVAHDLGVAHPPGYPSCTMYSKFSEVAFHSLSLGYLTPSMAMTFGHVLLSALAATFLFLAATRLTGLLAPGILAAGIFAFSPAVWTYAVVTEVFPLNNFFVSLLLLLCVWFHLANASQSPHCDRLVHLSAFICGLASTNQHTVVLYLVPVVLYVFASRPALFRPRKLLQCTLMYVLGLYPYLYLPWSTLAIGSESSWGQCDTLEGLKVHLLRRDYGTFSLGPVALFGAADLWRTTFAYFRDVQSQTLQYGWTLGVVWVLAVVRDVVRRHPMRRLQVLLLVMYVGYLAFFNARSNLPVDRPLLLGVVQRFWIQPLAVLVLLMAGGLGALEHVAAAATGDARASSSIFVAIAVALVAVQCGLHYEAQDQSDNHIIRDFGHAILTGLPNQTILITKGDIVINSVRYVQGFEGYRTDVVVADQEAMTYPWFIQRLQRHHPDLRIPHGAARYFPDAPDGFAMRAFVAANLPHSPMHLAFEWKPGDASVQGAYETRPWGLTLQILPAGQSAETLPEYLEGVRGLPSREFRSLTPRQLAIYPPHAWEVAVHNDYFALSQAQATFLLQAAEFCQERGILAPLPDNVGWSALTQTRDLHRWLYEHQRPEPSYTTCRNFGVALLLYLKFVKDEEALATAVDVFQYALNHIERGVEAAPGDAEGLTRVLRELRPRLPAQPGNGVCAAGPTAAAGSCSVTAPS